ncbi:MULTISPECIES: agmatinase family protein [Sphingobium]|uniref:Arginase n=2 Tax=Sphingobium cupriresistens TaxID=1132417 RepID=A0A0J7Y1X4_9SPHN|nr:MULTISPECIES: agmatinase family protein [Sphingobium]KMS57433.1 arginase [Sphingobium cupriresistens LL01]RYM14941.1 arginase [Sphingobium cupriresistens]WCP14448.1 Agmatinase [Sphingobium sp. AntQ-1]
MPSINAISGWGMAAAAAASAVVAGNGFDTPNPPPPLPQEDIMGEPKPIEIPADVMAKLSGIAPEKVALIKQGRTGRYVEKDALFGRIRTMPATELAAYIDAIAALHAQVEFQEGRDARTIPLDTRSAWFNAWKAKRPLVMDPRRDAGPMDLGRYIGGRRGGFATFAGAPVAMTPEDLKAGKVDVAIVGAPLDMGSGWRNAIDGPRALRMTGGAGGNDMYAMINPGSVLEIVDYGDIAIDQNSTERSVAHVREMVREIARTGAIPIVIGGDHSLEYPNVAAAADVHGKGNVSVVHFDSHYDVGRNGVHWITHGSPVYRVLHEGHVRPQDYIQVGLRARGPDLETFGWMRNKGMRYHTMVEVEKHGWDKVMDRAIAEARQNAKKLWISFDVDVLDPAFMPGTGTPVPGGLTMREAQPIMRRLCAENDIAGIDIVEVAPYLDTSYKTALNSNYLLNACLTGIAMRKKGLPPRYWNPVSSEHGQDAYYGPKKKS